MVLEDLRLRANGHGIAVSNSLSELDARPLIIRRCTLDGGRAAAVVIEGHVNRLIRCAAGTIHHDFDQGARGPVETNDLVGCELRDIQVPVVGRESQTDRQVQSAVARFTKRPQEGSVGREPQDRICGSIRRVENAAVVKGDVRGFIHASVVESAHKNAVAEWGPRRVEDLLSRDLLDQSRRSH